MLFVIFMTYDVNDYMYMYVYMMLIYFLVYTLYWVYDNTFYYKKLTVLCMI